MEKNNNIEYLFDFFKGHKKYILFNFKNYPNICDKKEDNPTENGLKFLGKAAITNIFCPGLKYVQKNEKWLVVFMEVFHNEKKKPTK